ncbi:MAG: glycosyltransferase involved in cell wall biosynthesis [Planctomycetaceae bacterium]|jgi:glycosyltransferase involved in cell wall biosynthesis
MMPRSPLTILQILPELDSGGVERGTLEVGAELVRRGHRSLVVSGGGRMVEQLEESGSQHFSASVGKKSPLTLQQVGWLRKLIIEQGVDIVHARSRVPAWVAWLALRKIPEAHRPKFVTTVHGQYSVSRFSEIMTRGERVIAVSGTIRDYIRENYPGTPIERVHTIYRGVDSAEFPHGYQPSAEWLREFHVEWPKLADKRLLTLPGRITRLKGHLDFLKMLSAVRDSGVDAHGLIVGGVDRRKRRYADEIRKAAAELGLEDDLTFTGHRSDMKEFYAVSDIVFSLSSKPESFGRTVLEALNLGTPVVGYSHGGVGEILNNVFPAGAVPVGDCLELTDRVTRLLEERLTVPPVSQYTLAEMLEQTLQLYEELEAGGDAASASAA